MTDVLTSIVRHEYNRQRMLRGAAFKTPFKVFFERTREYIGHANGRIVQYQPEGRVVRLSVRLTPKCSVATVLRVNIGQRGWLARLLTALGATAIVNPRTRQPLDEAAVVAMVAGGETIPSSVGLHAVYAKESPLALATGEPRSAPRGYAPGEVYTMVLRLRTLLEEVARRYGARLDADRPNFVLTVPDREFAHAAFDHLAQHVLENEKALRADIATALEEAVPEVMRLDRDHREDLINHHLAAVLDMIRMNETHIVSTFSNIGESHRDEVVRTLVQRHGSHAAVVEAVEKYQQARMQMTRRQGTSAASSASSSSSSSSSVTSSRDYFAARTATTAEVFPVDAMFEAMLIGGFFDKVKGAVNAIKKPFQSKEKQLEKSNARLAVTDLKNQQARDKAEQKLANAKDDKAASKAQAALDKAESKQRDADLKRQVNEAKSRVVDLKNQRNIGSAMEEVGASPSAQLFGALMGDHIGASMALSLVHEQVAHDLINASVTMTVIKQEEKKKTTTKEEEEVKKEEDDEEFEMPPFVPFNRVQQQQQQRLPPLPPLERVSSPPLPPPQKTRTKKIEKREEEEAMWLPPPAMEPLERKQPQVERILPRSATLTTTTTKTKTTVESAAITRAKTLVAATTVPMKQEKEREQQQRDDDHLDLLLHMKKNSAAKKAMAAAATTAGPTPRTTADLSDQGTLLRALQTQKQQQPPEPSPPAARPRPVPAIMSMLDLATKYGLSHATMLLYLQDRPSDVARIAAKNGQSLVLLSDALLRTLNGGRVDERAWTGDMSAVAVRISDASAGLGETTFYIHA